MMVEVPPPSIDENEDSFEEETISPPSPSERWAPIGASASAEETTPTKNDCSSSDGNSISAMANERLRELEEEQEKLNSSLLGLTTHFAQVQFRLKQIGDADSGDKERLLKELEEFAFRGCPDVMEVKKVRKWHSNAVGGSSLEHETIMEKQRAKQMQLIGQLKDQLQDLERFAYEMGEGDLPSNEVLNKQKAVLDKLHEKMNLNIELEKMSQDDLQKHVDIALKQLINPMKVKEQLVGQLQTQITDLERFIDFLQREGTPVGQVAFKCSCDTDSKECPLHNIEKRKNSQKVAKSQVTNLNSYILAYFGCRGRKFQKNELKLTSKGSHWGDLRANLELAIDSVMSVAKKYHLSSDEVSQQLKAYDSDEEDVDDVFEKCNEEIVTAVRKELCPALRDLLQHGLKDKTTVTGSSFAVFGCLPSRSQRPVSPGAGGVRPKAPDHVWDVLLHYYAMKHGREFSEAPVRKLSQSFNLESVAGRPVTSRQILLSTISNIRDTHQKLKRSPDAMFKAFVSSALNHKKLVAWLRIILRSREILDECYTPWSYVAKAGVDDFCVPLERLQQYTFLLPVDLAVRPFQHIKDAF